MVVTVCARVYQFSFQIRFHSFIDIPGGTCTEFNSALSKRRLSAAANTAADQDIDLLFIQKTCQCAMAAPV